MNSLPGVDLDRLRVELADALSAAPDDLQIEAIAGGRSNLTYRLTDGRRNWVLRRPPLGHVLATAHDMAREFRVMSALGTAGARVPRMILFQDDVSLIGAPFFVMDYVEGLVVRSDADARQLSETDAARAADDLVDQLVALHHIDAEAAGLGTLGRAEGFLARQVKRWQRQWSDSDGESTGVPLEQLAALLAQHLPSHSDATIVHGDYRLDNTILAGDDPGRVAAIVDWEMATLGDPLADLGLLVTYWSPLSARVTGSGHPVTSNSGFPSSAHLVERYEEASGRSVDDIDWYIAFGHFKLGVIAQTIQARFAKGLTVGEQFESAGQAVGDLINVGIERLSARV